MKKSKEARDLLISMAIGDGTVKTSGHLVVKHCVRQKEYLEWKITQLKNCGVNCTLPYYVSNNGYGAYEFRTYNSKFLKTLRKVLYNPKKRLTRKLLNRLTPLGIAIWYMDDGSISNYKDSGGTIKSSILTISTCLTKEENQVIIDYFQEVWGIRFGQRKMKNSFALCCRTKEARKFLKVIEPYVLQVECMKYKLSVKP